MDEIKRKVLDLITRDRYAPSAHFLLRAKQRNIVLDDALSVLRSGRLIPERAESDAEGRPLHYMLGRDTQGRRLGIVFIVDDAMDELKLITAIDL